MIQLRFGVKLNRRSGQCHQMTLAKLCDWLDVLYIHASQIIISLSNLQSCYVLLTLKV